MLLIHFFTLYCSTRCVIINNTKYKLGAIVHIWYDSNELLQILGNWVDVYTKQGFSKYEIYCIGKGLNPFQ